MPTATTTILKNGTLVLPQKLQKQWRGAQVYISAGTDDLFIKKMQTPTLTQMLDAFNKIGQQIPKRYLKEAIKAARSKAK